MTNTQQRVRRYTGMVGLIFVGERPVSVRTGAEILELAKKTYFFEEGRHIDEHGQRRYEYVAAPHSPNALIEALTEGRLLHRFTISGARPSEDFLPSGTYYTYVDFVESPEFNEARWIGRIIDDKGQVVRIVPNVEVKQVISFHPDDGHLSEEHSKPSITTHGFTEGKAGEAFMADIGSVASGCWCHETGDWTRLSSGGCSQTHFCIACCQ